MAPPRPAASLSPSLLARKGGAKPAMRAQIQPLQQFHEAAARENSEDLGWNDMGHDLAELDPSVRFTTLGEAAANQDDDGPINDLGLTPMGGEVVQLNGGASDEERSPANGKNPVVLDQRHKLSQAIVQPPVKRQSAFTIGRRAAFTFRIDPERHLRLRLASTISNRSAQELMTEALDRLLEDMPDVESLAEKVRKS